MDLSPEVEEEEEEEEFKIPLLGNSRSRELRNRIRSISPYIVCVAGAIAFVGLFVMCVLDDGNDDYLIQPELQLNSLLVFCPTIRGSVIWDFKFDLINPYNDSNFCINKGFGFEVSVFPYNQSSLLAKAFATTPVSTKEYCIVPGNRTSLIALVEDDSTSIQDLINDYFSDDDDQPINGTIRLDLKLHNHDYDLVCGDAKVELSNSSSWSSLPCGSMVGDQFACAYQPPLHPPSSQCRLLVCASPFLLLLAALVITAIIVSLALFVIVKCR